ncbi:hypothetical protein P691DRAFT_842333 [Macrolepiota fuliginosa MF-IS2]|uniref:Aminoglycoside phosphotransferase domain-containing protein n=1 Tax=Macrolepiota fuliginosa MF-IS2 TaxID=1400762 RepID=A0A9P5X628_9AGAR|nr:hypothetical protein P691DRAFT_842333 [Macrolepiota fuliginosa MF-IS2]
MLFVTQSGSSFSASRGYVNLRRSPLVEVLLMLSTYQNSLRVDLTVPSSSPCATTSKWSLVFRTRLRATSTTLWPAKWPQWNSSVPPGCLFPGSAHIENLKRYLLITSSLVPRDTALGHFCIRHLDLQQSNIIVQRSPDSSWKVVSLLDWQHASVLPLFLLAGMPQRLQNHDDPFSQSMTPPSLPENFDELEETERTTVEEVYRCRLAHYHYVTNTEEYNKPHYDAMTDHMYVLRSRLLNYASNPWEGETLELKTYARRWS